MSTRGRPKKYRIVRQNPKISLFSPRGRPGRPNEVNLTMDEMEALRLTDYLGYSQKEAARSMHISQQTFSRVLRRGRKTLAEGLISGKIIKIQGGTYVISSREDGKIKQLNKRKIN